MIKSSSSPLKVESKKDLSSVISKIPGESVTSTEIIIDIKSKSNSVLEMVSPVAV